jgi:hypothetical protein
MKQIAVLPPSSFEAPCPWDLGNSISTWLRLRVLELTYTSWDLRGFAREIGFDGPPFQFNPARRLYLRAELDAALFHLYGFARSDVEYVMDTFRIVREHDEQIFGGVYRTKDVLLDCYDGLAHAAAHAQSYRTPLSPPAADPSLTQATTKGVAEAQLLTGTGPVDPRSMPAGAWARPCAEPKHETMAAIAAVLKWTPRAAPARNIRLAATFVLEPRWLLPHLEPAAAGVWSHLVGPEADQLPKGVRALIPASDSSWGAALKQLRGSGRLVEDMAGDTWAAGSGLDGIDTSGWPDGRARYVLDVLQRLGVDAIVANLPAELKRSLDASAA